VRKRLKFSQMSSRTWAFLLLSLIVLTLLVFAGSNHGVSAEAQDARPRRSGTTATATPTPKPVPNQTPAAKVAPASSTRQSTSKPQTQVNRPAATPTPTPRPTPLPRTLQELGEPPPAPTPTPPEEYGEGERVIVDTELVTLNVRVIDRNNRPIDNVREEELHVYEDGVEQPIAFFTREEVPIGYGLAVDNSGSLRGQLESVINAAKAIINSNKPGDETFLVRFISSDKIETLQDFTSSQDLLMDALDNMYIEGGQTAVIDAVYLSAERVAEYKKGDDNDRRRRALIVVTDGEDRVSFYKQEQLFAQLREADVQIYVIGFISELDREGGFIRKSPRDKAMNLINKMASETGGRAFFPQSISELPQIANEIVRDMRTQYVLSYNPTNKARDGSYRAIRVTVSDAPSRDKRIALTRSGRVAPKGETPAPKPPGRTTTGSPKAVTTNKTPN